MTLSALIVVFVLAGILSFVGALRNFRRHRLLRGMLGSLLALALFLTAGSAVAIGAYLSTYQRLVEETPAGELQFTRLGYHQFNGVYTSPSGERSDFALRGDEWQIDARFLKWRPAANLAGFDAVYRLDRIGGRYAAVDDERSQPRTVYALHPPDRFDLWQLLRRAQAWIPGFDALYGTAAYLPMADGAQYRITASQSGLIARPLNQSARDAVGNWH